MRYVGGRRTLRGSVAFGGLCVAAIGGDVLLPAASAQTALPSVTVEAPQPRQPRPRVAKRAATAPPAARHVAAPAPVAQSQQTAPSGTGAAGAERANGPVAGYLANRSATGTKTDTPILTTPQSISVVPKDQIAAQGAQSVAEALQYTPGVSPQLLGPNLFFDAIKIRGFDAPRYLDGLKLPADTTGFAIPRIEPYGLERLEVLKGPSSGLYGLSEPGGLINMVSKRPTDTAHYEWLTTLGSYGRVQGAFDVGGPLDKNGEFLARIVGLARNSNTWTDFVEDNKRFIAPSFTWRPSNETTFTILAQYSKIDNKGYQQYVPAEVAFLPNPNGRIPVSRYFGEPSAPGDGVRLEQAAIGYAFEHRFSNNLQFRQNFRYTDVSNDLLANRTEGILPDNRSVLRTYNYVKADARNVALDNQVQADFLTGPVSHTVLVGLDYFNLQSHSDYRSIPVTSIDAYAPVYGALVPSFDSLQPAILRDNKVSQLGLYAQDQLKFDRWTLTLTGRQDWVQTRDVSYAPAFLPLPGRYDRDDAATTGRVGLNYLFDFGLSPYVSYATSFVPNTGEFKPTTGEGKEIGVKFKPVGMNLMLTAALFEINRKDVLTPNPSDPFVNVQTDSQRVRGFEFEARGNVTRELEIIGAYTFMDPKVTASVAGHAGKNIYAVPSHLASLWANYTWYSGPLAGLGLGGGVRYVSESYVDDLNTVLVPSYTVFDAAVSYDFGYLRPELRGWKAQVNVTNLTNRYYVGSCLGGTAYCGLGAPRTILGTLRYAWSAEPVKPPLIIK